jgi:dihydrofolate synthase / folylpolyglutamate synthase
MTLVLGILRDKDAPGIVAPLLGRAHRVVLTASANPRAARPDDLRALVPATLPVDVASSVAEALARAAEPSVPLVCVAGSLSLVGDALRSLAGDDKPCPVEIPA